MSVALLMAVRAQVAIDELAALRARPAKDVQAERELATALSAVLQPVADRVADHAAGIGVPNDELSVRLALGDLRKIEADLFDVLAEHVGAEVLAAIEHVDSEVARAGKQLPDELRPAGMDKRLFETLTRLGSSMLARFTGRTIDALAGAAQVQLPRDDVRSLLGEMLEAELSQLSRHALGDARNEATEVAERRAGVEFHRWVTAGDDDVRPAHADVDGEVVRVGDAFSNGWRRPGGLGCRCHLEPVLDAAA